MLADRTQREAGIQRQLSACQLTVLASRHWVPAGEKFAGGAGEAADVVSGFEKGVGEATADVAGGSQNGDGRG